MPKPRWAPGFLQVSGRRAQQPCATGVPPAETQLARLAGDFCLPVGTGASPRQAAARGLCSFLRVPSPQMAGSLPPSAVYKDTEPHAVENLISHPACCVSTCGAQTRGRPGSLPAGCRGRGLWGGPGGSPRPCSAGQGALPAGRSGGSPSLPGRWEPPARLNRAAGAAVELCCHPPASPTASSGLRAPGRAGPATKPASGPRPGTKPASGPWRGGGWPWGAPPGSFGRQHRGLWHHRQPQPERGFGSSFPHGPSAP